MDQILLAEARWIAQDNYNEYDMDKICHAVKLGRKIMDREDLFTQDERRDVEMMVNIGLAKINNMERKKNEPIG